MRILPWMMLASVGAAALAAACGDTINEGDVHHGPGTAPPATDPDGGDVTAMNDGLNTTGMGAGSGAATGLPCDVQQLLENRCIGCHLGPSPPALLTYADLMKPSSDPSKNLAQRSLERMQSTSSPMPPAPAVAPTAAEITTFQAWVTAGTPMGTACTTTPPASDGGTTTTPTVCTSGITKTGSEGSTMRPGEACITCHTMRGGPAFSIAGTVYPTAHEPNDCVGVAGGGLTVVVTDKNGSTINLPVNSVGNFQYSGAVAAPFHVKVTNGTTVRAMADSLTAGDCNSCHTVNGFNGAPGRIMAP
ncbi:MAG TPA: hypothetical protein VIF62_14910 [Labilithrix sp.]